jgi:hypothetical protein
MKRLTILVCILVMLLSLPGVASASPPERKTFTITGCQVPETELLPSGLIKFRVTAEGTVSGDFGGTFSFDEWGIVDQSWRGTNHGIMSIKTYDNGKVVGEVVISFNGRTEFFAVWGNFTVLQATGAYEHLHGQGTYATGNGDPPTNYALPFTVDFTGQFHSDPP